MYVIHEMYHLLDVSIKREQMMKDLEKKNIEKDVKKLKASALNKKYAKAYNSWRAMRQRRKTHNAIVHKDFDKFASFLLIMGDKPSDEYTLDRINNEDPEYSPDKVRWATKKQQSNNKSDNVLLTNVEGETYTLAEWAYKTEQSPDTLRKRRARGWNDTEIITGIRDKGVALKLQPFPHKTKDKWENKWLDHALEGGNLTRLEFLCVELKKKIALQINKLELIGFMLVAECPDYAVGSFLEEVPDNSYLYDYHDFLKSLKKKKLKNKKRKIKKYLKKTKPMLKEVEEQINYDKQYKKALEKRPDTLTKGQFRDYYAKRKPRPHYTVNLPPDMS